MTVYGSRFRRWISKFVTHNNNIVGINILKYKQIRLRTY